MWKTEGLESQVVSLLLFRIDNGINPLFSSSEYRGHLGVCLT